MTNEEWNEIPQVKPEITTAEEFNTKYKEFLKEGHYGMSYSDPVALKYLDEQFQKLIKIPGFKYIQIKSKWNYFCAYLENVPREKVIEIEQKLKEIDDESKK